MLKKPLRKLNFDQGNLFDNVKTLRMELSSIQTAMVADPHSCVLREAEVKCLKSYKAALKDKESFLKQKSKATWLKEGDMNSKYFHNVVKGRLNRGRIYSVEDVNGIAHFRNDDGTQFVSQFQNVLGKSSNVKPIEDPYYLFHNKLSAADALFMIRDVSDDEVKMALFDIDRNKAPGLNGFSSHFFKAAWSTIGADVCKAVKEFFKSGKLLKEVNTTVISLVPKLQTPRVVSDYRPIACYNVVYKIISKILVRNRVMDWKNKSLSFAGRLQLISSVIGSMQIYWSLMFILPVAISNDIERLMRDFLWNYGVFKKGKAKDTPDKGNASWSWKKILRIRGLLMDHLVHKIGNGLDTSIWFVGLLEIDPPVLKSDKKDKVMWKTNSGRLVDFAVSSVWNDIRVLGRLKTQDKMGIWEKKDDLKLWSRLKGLVRLENAPNNWSDILLCMLQRPFNKSIWSVLQILLIGASIYFIWMERNLKIFQGKSRSVDGICSMIKEAVRLKIMGLTLNDTARVFEAANLCVSDVDVSLWLHYNEDMFSLFFPMKLKKNYLLMTDAEWFSYRSYYQSSLVSFGCEDACSFMLYDLNFEPLSLSLSSMPSCDLVSLTKILIRCLILKASNQSLRKSLSLNLEIS
ncbi:hypothetical protein Tco_0328380 [Tanacetum coccineum]